MKTAYWLLATALLLGACAGPNVTQYAQEQPVLDPTVYFAGQSEAWGMFQQRDGTVIKRFHVALTGQRTGDKFILNEQFAWSDGSQSQRAWTLWRTADGVWHGTAADVAGEAIGHASGNALNWQYTLHLPVDNQVVDVRMDDWMYQMDRDTLINRTSMHKFGVEVGQVTLFFRKLPPGARS
ncbi:DUF3833 domain-containing protein [Silvimonas iriomotensis]|uniref:Lipoprotein n=1 Tax=Silvimonas iriomotensis TaxID=449662 RepID=A0ABQ2P9V3_9NEIS|nr:DUF3833 domain-containing protein [Silvimonas iriomotensis]GGP21168.1 lipoprotein [Silvimonas iriomotensis]